MVRVSPPSVSAASGEISELMFGRRDYVRYQNGLRACRGFMVLPEGPVTRLPGTRYLSTTLSNAAVRLMPFVFKDEDAVMLEWGNNTLRFWRNGALVMNGASPYQISTPYSVAQAMTLQTLNSSDRIYLTGGGVRPYTLSRFALTNWTLEPTEFQNGPFAPRNLDQAKELTVSGVTGTITVTSNFDLFETGHIGTQIELRSVNDADVPFWTADENANVGDVVRRDGNYYRLAGFAGSGVTYTVEPTVGAAPDYPVSPDGQAIWRAVIEGNPGNVPNWTAGDTSLKVLDRRYLPGDDWTIELVAFAPQARTGTTEPTVTGVGNVVSQDGGVRWVAVLEDSGTPNPDSEPVWQSEELINIGERRYLPTAFWTVEAASFVEAQGNSGINPPVHLEGFALTDPNGGPVYEFLSDGQGIIEITARASARSATATVVKRLPDTLLNRATYRWSEAAWSDMRGWPRAIGAFQQRHVYGGTDTDPRTLWHSVIGGTTDMASGTNDDDGFAYTLDSDRRDNGEIRWIVGAAGILHVGTTAGEFYGRSTDIDRAYSAATAKFTDDTDIGSADADPVVAFGKLAFLGKTKRNLHVPMLDNTGEFVTDDLTQIARHILGAGCDKIVFQRFPVPVIWGRRIDGQLVGVTFNPRQQVIGWHVHTLGDGGQLVDLAVLPTASGVSEELWLIVRRGTSHFVEVMQDPFVDLDGIVRGLSDAWHQFAAIRYTGAATTTISGLSHLNGRTVTAWTELGGFADLTVASGAVTLPRPVTTAIVGLCAAEDQRIDTLDIVMGTPDGGDDGRLRTHRRTGLRVHKTTNGKVSVVTVTKGVERASRPEPIQHPRMYEAPTLVDGIFEIAGMKAQADQIYLRLQPDPGAPLTMVARTPTLMITDS